MAGRGRRCYFEKSSIGRFSSLQFDRGRRAVVFGQTSKSRLSKLLNRTLLLEGGNGHCGISRVLMGSPLLESQLR